MNRIAENIARINSELPQTTQFIVVSKYREIEEIQQVYNCNPRVFGWWKGRHIDPQKVIP
jgi:uncharacterized pyridoxal phosphate-containing UPF0001 family protein